MKTHPKKPPGCSVNAAALPPAPIECSGSCYRVLARLARPGPRRKPTEITLSLRGRRQAGNRSRFLLLAFSLVIDGQEILAHQFTRAPRFTDLGLRDA